MSYNFYAFMDRMKYIKRWSLMRSVREENIMEHSQQVAFIAHALAVITNKLYGGNLDCEKCVLYAIYHECSEVLTGDLPTPIKYFNRSITGAYKDIESAACDKLLATLPEQTQGAELTAGPGIHLVCGPNARARKLFCEQAAKDRTILLSPPADPAGHSRDECFFSIREGFPGRHQKLIRKKAGEGLFITGCLCSRHPRRSLANILHEMVPGQPITCTFVLSPSEKPWIPEVPEPSARDGLPHPVPRLTMPCMLHEPRLSGARIVLVCPDKS